MTFNLLVISLTVFLGLVFADPKIIGWPEEAKRKGYIIVVCLILILQSGLRHVAVGADTYAYYMTFEWVKKTEMNTLINYFLEFYKSNLGKDPGYNILQKLFQYISGSYRMFLLFIAILFFTSFGHFVYKNTETIVQAIFSFVLYSALFYSFFSITGHRQTIATALVLFGFELIKRRKLILFLTIIFTASTIHRSSLIFLPFYLIYNFKLTSRMIPLVFVAFIISMSYRISISAYLKELAGYQNYGIYAGAGTYVFSAMLLLVALFVWWRMKTVLNSNPQTRSYFNAFFIALILTPLTWVNPSAMRAVQYFSIFMLVLLPHLFDSLPSLRYKLRRIFYIGAVIALVMLFIKGNYGSEYRFFWQEMELGSNYTHLRNIIY